MKKVLLAGTAVACVGLMTSPASAADGIKLEFGGFFNEAYMTAIDNQLNEHNADGFVLNEADGQPFSVNIDFGGFVVGGMFQYSRNNLDQGPTDLDRWVAGIGAGYTIDAWSVGVQYSHLDQSSSDNSVGVEQFQQDRLMLTGNYALSPGINLGGELGYSWIDANPEGGAINGTKGDDAFEIGIGTNFQF